MKVKLLKRLRRDVKIISFIHNDKTQLYSFWFNLTYYCNHSKDGILEDFIHAVRKKYYPRIKGQRYSRYKRNEKKIWWTS